MTDIHLLSEKFDAEGYAGQNILTSYPQLERVANTLNDIADDKWLYIVKRSTLEEDFNRTQNTDIEHNYKLALAEHDAGKFTFAFSRITCEEPSLAMPEIKEMHQLFDGELKAYASKITGRKLNKMAIFYVTKFDKGDFLTTHCDSGNSVGIVLNLSVDWNPVNGGLTVMLPKKDELSGHTFMPNLGNSLVFDVKDRRILHFVSMVNNNQSQKRISIVARYDE